MFCFVLFLGEVGKRFQPKSSDSIASFDCVAPAATAEEHFEKLPTGSLIDQATRLSPAPDKTQEGDKISLKQTESSPATLGDALTSQVEEVEAEAEVDSQTSIVGSPRALCELVEASSAVKTSQERIALLEDATQGAHFVKPTSAVDQRLQAVAVTCDADSVASANSTNSAFENIDPAAAVVQQHQQLRQQLQNVHLSDNDSYVHVDDDVIPYADPMQDGATRVGDSCFYLPLLHASDAMSSSGELPSQRRNTNDIDWDWSISFEQFLASMLTEPALVDYFEAKLDLKPAIDRFRNRRLVERTISSESDVTTAYRKV